MRGADHVAKALQNAGVETVFSLSGNQIMPVYDALLDVDIRVVHTRHEAAAVFMADAWAQVTGQPGIALLTAGPGFANALGAVYATSMAESPVLILSGDGPVSQDGTGSFQEMAQVAMAQPVTKLSRRVTTTGKVAEEVEDALAVAQAGRPGPVHLALPADVLTGKAEAEAKRNAGQDRTSPPTEPDIAALGRWLGSLDRPLILAGPHLCRPRFAGLRADLAATTGAPVIPMESPRGLNDPALGALRSAIAEADGVLLLGKKLDFTLGRGTALQDGVPVAVVDAESAVLERVREAAPGPVGPVVLADPDLAATALIAMSGRARPDWVNTVSSALDKRAEGTGQTLNSPALCAAVRQALAKAPNPVLIADGGEIGQWAQAGIAPPLRVINGPSGAIGGGLSYAIAAKLALPEATVVLMSGDGSIGFHFAECETALREGAAITAVIGVDTLWNAEHQIQIRSFGADRAYGCGMDPRARYDLAAAGFGWHGAQVTEADGLPDALAIAFGSDLPAMLDVRIEGLPAPTLG
ncbi:MAG: thiamine pyrophosphate-binding protein [Pseudomonadota bacterium]